MSFKTPTLHVGTITLHKLPSYYCIKIQQILLVAFTMGSMMRKALGQGHSPHKGPRRRQSGLDLVIKHLK